ncbi:hypothetical protein GQR58_007344 [Nymphon striatum]|nr:hypothetical protein GQR58_007344 [Nymphon striatum]
MAVTIIPDNYFSPLFGNCLIEDYVGPSTFNAMDVTVRFNRECLNSDMTDLLTTQMCDIMETLENLKEDINRQMWKKWKKNEKNNFEVNYNRMDMAVQICHKP